VHRTKLANHAELTWHVTANEANDWLAMLLANGWFFLANDVIRGVEKMDYNRFSAPEASEICAYANNGDLSTK